MRRDAHTAAHTTPRCEKCGGPKPGERLTCSLEECPYADNMTYGQGLPPAGGWKRDMTAARGRPEALLSDAELLAAASARPWYFDGWDIFTAGSSAGPRGDGHRLVVPLSHLNETFHESQQVSRCDAELIVRAVNSFVGR